MHFLKSLATIGLLVSLGSAYTTKEKDAVAVLAKLNKRALKALKNAGEGGCTLETATKRKDWYVTRR